MFIKITPVQLCVYMQSMVEMIGYVYIIRFLLSKVVFIDVLTVFDEVAVNAVNALFTLTLCLSFSKLQHKCLVKYLPN